MPQTVAVELQRSRTPACVSRWIANPPLPWIRIEPAQGPTDEALDELDPGERDVIRLALVSGLQTVLIDETEGRREAQRRCLRVTGTLGVLERGATLGLLDLRSALACLVKTNFRARESLILGLLERDAVRAKRLHAVVPVRRLN